MKKHIVRNGRKILGFVTQDSKGEYWYQFGKPSQDNYISFHCRSLEHGIACIQMYQRIC
jgi:hypothetical protein